MGYEGYSNATYRRKIAFKGDQFEDSDGPFCLPDHVESWVKAKHESGDLFEKGSLDLVVITEDGEEFEYKASWEPVTETKFDIRKA